MILKPSELTQYGKKCTTADEEATRGIREAEIFDVIPSIGATLYEQIEQRPYDYEELLEGGVAFNKTGCIGGAAMLLGLKMAIAYYAEARIAQNNNVQLDRFGAKVKNSEYSSQAEKEMIDSESVYLHTLGDKAMQSILDYLSTKKADPRYALYIQRPNDDERAQFEDITLVNP